jgi:UDP-GlcNAc3NAcA epimerase
MKIITIIGARPQFVKAAAISRELIKYENISETIIHTGQHFDQNMSEVFFDEMKIPKPKYNLNVNNLSHGAMTGKILEKTEKILMDEKPDYVIVYGDTNSTLAGALAAKKMNIKLLHIEAGLRSYNMNMPEEINRILTDRISDILFCPTDTAVENLRKEGFATFKTKYLNVGDVMFDSALYYGQMAKKPNIDMPQNYILATVHRAENTDSEDRLEQIFDALNRIAKDKSVILPLHPRTKKIIENKKIPIGNITVIEPVGYLQILFLLKNSDAVFTDSGGMQKEAFFFEKPCVTMRDETEWTELVDSKYNILVGADREKIMLAYEDIKKNKIIFDKKLYGQGNSSELIIREIIKDYGRDI